MQTPQSVTDFFGVANWQLDLTSKCCDRVAPLLGITKLDRAKYPIEAFFTKPDVSLSTWLESFALEFSRKEAKQALKTITQLRSLPRWRILWVLSSLYLLALCMTDEHSTESRPTHGDGENSTPPHNHRNLSHMLLLGIGFACGCSPKSRPRNKGNLAGAPPHLSDTSNSNRKPLRKTKITRNSIAHWGVVALATNGVLVTHANLRKRCEYASAPAWRGYYELAGWYSGGAKNMRNKIFFAVVHAASFAYLTVFVLRWSFWLAHRLSVLHR